ncbi:uncharacterized protein ISCGN_018819 [Ixodes scapularis]
MSAIECLVSYGAHKIVVVVDGEHKRADLIRTLAGNVLFQGVDLQTSHIQVYHPRYKTDVDLMEGTILEDAALVTISLDESQFRIMDVVIQEDSAPSKAPSKAPSEYRFPKVPLDIAQALQKHTRGQYLPCRSRIIQWLFHDLCLYDLYPDKLYAEAARSLVENFPTLKDTTGSGFDSWRVAMRYKAKRERSKLRMQDNTEKQASPRNQPRASRDPNPKRVTRPGTNIVLPAHGEDDESLQGHIINMEKELRKANPNVAYVSDSMSRTLATRRAWITTDHPSVAAIVAKYPAFEHSSFLQQEFTAVTSKPMEVSLAACLSESCLRILDAARKKRHLCSFFEDLDRRVAQGDKGPEDEVLTTAALHVLPSLVKERSSAFLYPHDPDALQAYPAVSYEENVYESSSFIVTVDGLHVKEDSLLGAITTMTAMYWVFNMEFSPRASKTMQLMSHVFGVNSGIPASPLVRVAIGILCG